MTRYTDLFGDDGPLAAALPGYGYRPEQAAMAGAADWLMRMAGFWETRLDALEEALRKEVGDG